jgi:hypothetical protein
MFVGVGRELLTKRKLDERLLAAGSEEGRRSRE